MYKLAVFGNPIAHSLSPQIHQQFAAQFALNVSYKKMLAPLDGFKKMVQAFFAEDALGCNVTLPFKVEAFELVDQLSDRAKQAGAVNTIKCQDGKLFGDNTDGVGFIRDLHAKHIDVKNKKIIIVGAGGAVRGILPALINQSPAEIVIMNRDLEKAKALVSVIKRQLKPDNLRSAVAKLNTSDIDNATLLIDGTSTFDVVQQLLMHGNLPNSLTVYDLKYGREQPTSLIQWANAQGLKAYDGLGMLIEQAAAAFALWFGKHPNTSCIYLR